MIVFSFKVKKEAAKAKLTAETAGKLATGKKFGGENDAKFTVVYSGETYPKAADLKPKEPVEITKVQPAAIVAREFDIEANSFGVLAAMPKVELAKLQATEEKTKEQFIAQMDAHLQETFDWLTLLVKGEDASLGGTKFNIVIPGTADQAAAQQTNMGTDIAPTQWKAGGLFTDAEHATFMGKLNAHVKALVEHGAANKVNGVDKDGVEKPYNPVHIGWLPASLEDAKKMQATQENGDAGVLPNPIDHTIWLWGANAGNALKTGGGAGQANFIEGKDDKKATVYTGKGAELKFMKDAAGNETPKLDADGKQEVAKPAENPIGYTVGVVTTPLGLNVKKDE